MHSAKQARSKILSRSELRRRAAEWQRAGERITLANGAFDLLHVGHVRYLRGAKALGGKLVVAINSDDSVRSLKGKGRPVVPESERAEIVAALADVDAVVVFPELDVRALICEIRPDIQAKGTDYTAESVPERDTMMECGGRVEIVGDPKAHSTTEIIRSRKSPFRKPSSGKSSSSDSSSRKSSASKSSARKSSSRKSYSRKAEKS